MLIKHTNDGLLSENGRHGNYPQIHVAIAVGDLELTVLRDTGLGDVHPCPILDASDQRAVFVERALAKVLDHTEYSHEHRVAHLLGQNMDVRCPDMQCSAHQVHRVFQVLFSRGAF